MSSVFEACNLMDAGFCLWIGAGVTAHLAQGAAAVRRGSALFARVSGLVTQSVPVSFGAVLAVVSHRVSSSRDPFRYRRTL